jgi:hypothetical protein
LHDACYDSLIDDAAVAKEFAAEQSKGAYDIVVRGVPGAYFVTAPEYDDEGVFDTLNEAIAYVELNFGEFIVDDNGAE